MKTSSQSKTSMKDLNSTPTFFSKPPVHILALIVFILVSIFFNMPAFQGNKLASHDYFQWAYGAQETIDYYKSTGENAQWTNSLFGGMPAMMLDYFPGTNWFQKMWHTAMGYDIGQPFNPAFFFFWAMLCFYLLSNALKVNPIIGVLGSVAYAFSTYHPIIIAAGHSTKMVDLAFLPGIIAGIIFSYKGRPLLGAAIAGLFLAFFLDAGHYQIIFYSAIFCGFICLGYLVEAIQTQRLKNWLISSGLLAVVAIFALLSTSSRIIQVYDYSPHSMRGGQSVFSEGHSEGLDKEYAFAWSNGIGEAFCILVPDLYGSSSQFKLKEGSNYEQSLIQLGVSPQDAQRMNATAPTYWGPQSSLAGPIYFGAAICFLAVLGLFSIRSSLKWWILGAGILCMFFSFGKNMAWFNYFLFDHLPMFNKLRSPNMALTITGLSFPILAVWGLHSFIKDRIPEGNGVLLLRKTGIVVGGALLIILIGLLTSFDFIGANDEAFKQQFAGIFGAQGAHNIWSALIEDRKSMAYSSWLKSFAWIGISMALLVAFAKNKIKQLPTLVLLTIVVSIDLMSVGKRYLNQDNYLDQFTFDQQFQPTDTDRDILKDPDLYYRVYDLRQSPFNDSKASTFHKSIGGYHPAKSQSYQDLITAHISQFNGAVLSMLNTKYIITRDNQGQEIYHINPDALGNAWFVREAKIVKNRKDALMALESSPLGAPNHPNDFIPKEEVVITENIANKLTSLQWEKEDNGINDPTIILTSYAPHQLTYEANNPEGGFAVFSDLYFEAGWIAKIGQNEVPIHEVNFLLRGIEVPAGQHTITFTYEAPKFKQGERLGMIGSIGVSVFILAAIAQLFIYRKEKGQKNQP